MNTIKNALNERRERRRVNKKISEYNTRIDSIKYLFEDGLTLKEQINLFEDFKSRFETKMRNHLKLDLEEVQDLKNFLE